MSKETKFKYFLDGKEVTKEAIDWNRSLSITPVRNTDEVHVTYMNYEAKPVEKTTPACGLSTRHKACNTGYPVLKLDKDKLQNLLKEFEFFDNSTWKGAKIEKVEPLSQKTIFEMMEDKMGLLPIDTRRTSSADELKMTYPRPRPITVEDLAKVREALNRPTGIDEGFVRETPVGVKHNKHKAPLDIVQTRQFPKALQLIALATAFGNKKYEATDKDFLNFKRVAGGSQTYFDAAARHNTDRNEIDEETGLPHVIHAVWDMLAGLEMYIEENKLDVKEFSKNYLENLHKSK